MTIRLADNVQAIGPTLDLGTSRRAHVTLDGGSRLVSLDPSSAQLLRDIAAGGLANPSESETVRGLVNAGLLTENELETHVSVGAGSTVPGRLHLVDPERLLRGVSLPGPRTRAVLAIATGSFFLVAAGWTATALSEHLMLLASSWSLLIPVIVLVMLGTVLHEFAHASTLVAAGGSCRSIGLTSRPAPGMYADVKTIVMIADPGARVAVYGAGLLLSAGWAAVLMLASWVPGLTPWWSAAVALGGWATAALLLVNALPWTGSDMQRMLHHHRIRPLGHRPADTNTRGPHCAG